MLQRVKMDGIEFPRLYIAENLNDAMIARDNGLPYIVWKNGMDSLVKSLLRPAIEKLFPYIDWNKVLGPRKAIRSKVHIVEGYDPDTYIEVDKEYEHQESKEVDYNKKAIDAQLEYERESPFVDELDGNAEITRDVEIADTTRMIDGGGHDVSFTPDKVSVFDYIGDLSSNVDIDVLQKLALLPKFVGDVADCIKINLSNRMRWTEGYNKKLSSTVGKFEGRGQLPNLIIIDISASIPDGIAATMITLAETLRNQCNADLIITSSKTVFYPAGTELPNEQAIRDYFGRGNESYEISKVLERHIKGREFGHVISFGDNDTPWLMHYASRSVAKGGIDLAGTKVHEVHHYHTYAKTDTGYARWAMDCSPDKVHYDTDWCRVML